MFHTLARSWELGRQSLWVLRHERQLVIFPLLSSIALLLVMASFALPFLTIADMGALVRNEAVEIPIDSWLVYVLLFLFYFVNYFVIVFFNSALIACAMNRFSGYDADIGSGLRVAASRLPQIIAWAAVSATVGVLLRMLSERAGFVGRLAIAAVGMAWAVATYFVVPVLVVERAGPFSAIGRSAGIMRKTWGEALVSKVGLSALTFVALLCASVPLVVGVAAGYLAESIFLMALGIGITVILWIAVSLITSALDVILVAALYRYATTGLVPEHFDGATLRNMFVSERQSARRRRSSVG